MNARIYFVFSVLIALWALVVVRGFVLQIFPDERITSLKARQYTTSITLSERRGNITDRSGREVAFSMSSFSLFADPQLIERPRATAAKLAKFLKMSPKNLYEKLSTDKRFVWIARQLSSKDKNSIEGFKIHGLGFLSDYKRIYPDDQLFSPLLGLTGNEGQGLEGVELTYDRELIGSGRKVILGRDARGRPLLTPGVVEENTSENEEIQLTLDSQVQHFLNRELEETKTKFDADQAMGLVLDAKTSAILAAVQLSDFDQQRGEGRGTFRNRLIGDVFEPGSTLKPFAVASALMNKKMTPSTRINTENGFFQVGRHIIREAMVTDKWKDLNASEILAYSSNIGASKIALMLGDEALSKTLFDFGFGSKTGVDLPGEAKGIVANLPWNDHLLCSTSFGQGIAVTPLQLASAYATIANDGVFQRPHVLGKIRNLKTETEEFYSASVPRRIISSEVAQQMRILLEGVTAPHGTGASARVDGFLVAGKTGTAQKASVDSRGYSPDAYVSSFAGFLPANDPAYVVVILIDHPKKLSHFGAQVAAPVFARVGSFLMRKDGRVPLLLSEDKRNVRKVRTVATSSIIQTVSDASTTTASAADTSVGDVVPPLRGLTIREVMNRLKDKDIQISFQGDGIVRETIPTEGEPLRDIKVILR